MDGVVELHRRAFGPGRPRAALESFLTDICFRHPWRSEGVRSLGWDDGDGGLRGCICAMPRPMRLGDRSLQVVVTHNFMVDPSARGSLAAIRLMRAVLAQGQDVTLCQGNETSRSISEALGARRVAVRSGRWLRVLRPAGLATHAADRWLAERSAAWSLPGVLRQAAEVPDAILRRLPLIAAPAGKDGARDEAMDPDRHHALLEVQAARARLGPVYTPDAVAWMHDVLSATRRAQELRARVVREHGRDVGWYAYYSRPGGIGRVLQLGSEPGCRKSVLALLLADAAREGNVALTGQADPAWEDALAATACVPREGRTSLLVHSSDDAVGEAFGRPDAFFSSLEGEGWLQLSF